MEDREEKAISNKIQIISASPQLDEQAQVAYVNVNLQVEVIPGQLVAIQLIADKNGEITAIEKKQPIQKSWYRIISTPFVKIKNHSKLWLTTINLSRGKFSQWIAHPNGLFLIAIIFYLLTRLIGLDNFPIYFFTDEAIQTVSAADLVRDHFFSPDRIFLPTYFQNGNFYNLSVSVYAQVIPYLLFGKSVIATRSVSAILSLLAGMSLAWSFRWVGKEFGRRKNDQAMPAQAEAWWSVVLFLSIIPAWYLHSRTAFETVLFCSFFAMYLAAYLLYRYRSSSYIYLAVLSGAFAFYSYSPGQVVLAVFTVGVLISDFRYHWRNRKAIIGGVILGLICLIPYFRFLSYHESAPFEHLRNLDSYWMTPIPFFEKIGRYAHEYLNGLNPYYWFIPNDRDLIRHVMKGYGNLGWFNLPFILIGLVVLMKHLYNSANRVILLAILAAPSGAALVGIGITRVLVMVVPMTMVAALGWQSILDWVGKERRLTKSGDDFPIPGYPRNVASTRVLNKRVAQAALFIVLAGINLYMLWDGLHNAPTWFDDYGLYGMQYGARQLFEEVIPRYIQADSKNKLFVSSLWANGADVFIRFFIPEEYANRITMGSIDTYLSQKTPLDEQTIFILTPEEFRQALASPKMRYLGMLETIPYPNGKDGFYVIRLGYVNNVDQIFTAEREARRHLIVENIVIQGYPARVQFSPIDAGQLSDAFDGDVFTLTRGLEANPFILDILLTQSLAIKGISGDFGSMDFEIKVILYNDQYPDGMVITQTYKGLPPDPHIELLFPKAYQGNRIRIEVLSLSEGEIAKIHLREIHFIQ